MTVPCPRCPAGSVAVHVDAWDTPQGERRSVWVDEPLSCSGGCVLTGREVERLLAGVYERPVQQLSLFAWQERVGEAAGD